MTWGRVRASLARVRCSLEPFHRVERGSDHAVNLVIVTLGTFQVARACAEGRAKPVVFPTAVICRLPARRNERCRSERTVKRGGVAS